VVQVEEMYLTLTTRRKVGVNQEKVELEEPDVGVVEE
jgi:hypothetical protein